MTSLGFVMCGAALKLTHFSKFQNETLFYIFYAMPKDALQVTPQHNIHTQTHVLCPCHLLPVPQLAPQTHPPSRARGGLFRVSARGVGSLKV